jgi:hypothetical protein
MRPRLRLAITTVRLAATASLSRWTHQVGVTGGICGILTPTWNPIEFSSPVAFADGVEVGELNSWDSFLPLVRDEGLKTALVTGGGDT